MKITLLDYGAGNLHSLAKALAAGGQVVVEPDPLRALSTDLLVLPGVGAFGAAAQRLAPALSEARQALRGGLACLGICLGMQLLFDSSEEGEGQGLGVFPGRVSRLAARRVPHIGWNSVEATAATSGLPALAYYAHSFACRPAEPACVLAWTAHEEDRFPAAVGAGRVLGLQFHPEKSSREGLACLAAFVERVRS